MQHQNQELETRAASRGLGSEGVQQRVGAPSHYRPSGLPMIMALRTCAGVPP
jgi:hypothetical protein